MMVISDLRVFENRIVPTGQIIVSKDWIVLHPYTTIHITSKTYLEELTLVIADLTKTADRRFDTRILKETP